MPDPEQKTEKGREEEVMSEVMERSMEGNVKLLLGNEIAHANRMNVLAETAVADTINLSRKANDAYLETTKQQNDAYMEMSKQQANTYMEQSKKQAEETLKLTSKLWQDLIENNRYTLDRLYSVYPEEAAGIATILKALLAAGIITVKPPEGS